MRRFSFPLMIVGIIAMLMGLLWIGQGTGIVRWPEVSPMINQMPWAYRGAGLAVIGFVAWIIGRRMRR